jgi:hypothetical protein
MAKKKLVKKMVLTVGLKGLPENEFTTKTTTMANDAQTNLTLVPDLDPTPAAELAKIANYQSLLAMRESLKNQQLQNTELILAAREEITNDITSDWMPYAQTQVAGDAAQAKVLGYGIKGQSDAGGGLPSEKAAQSHPTITRIDLNVHLQHALHTVNSQSGKNKLPDDASHIEIYEQIGGTEPISIIGMNKVGICKHGTFINHFAATDLGKTVYYIAVYIDKKSLVVLVQSPVESAIIN